MIRSAPARPRQALTLRTLLISTLPLLACGCGSSAPDSAPQVLTAFYDHIAAQEFSIACGLLDADTAARLSSERLSCPELFSAGYQDLIVGAVHINPASSSRNRPPPASRRGRSPGPATPAATRQCNSYSATTSGASPKESGEPARSNRTDARYRAAPSPANAETTPAGRPGQASPELQQGCCRWVALCGRVHGGGG